MNLNIEIDGEESIYSFPNQNIVTIGRAPSSDIQLLVEGISRNHIEIQRKTGDFFVVDTGSTNGTFINDQRIEIGVQETFNSFFPVKLGFNVYLNLLDELSDEQMNNAIKLDLNKADYSQDDESTKMINLNDLRAQLEASAEDAKESDSQTPEPTTSSSIEAKKKNMMHVPANEGQVETGSSTIGKRKVSKKSGVISRKPVPTSNKNSLIVGALILVAVVVFGYKEILLLVNPPAPVPIVLKKRKPIQKPVNKVLLAKKMAEKDKQIKKVIQDSMMSSITRDKCLGAVEALYCSDFKQLRTRSYYEGYSRIDTTMYLAIEVDKSFDFFQNYFSYTENEKAALAAEVKKLYGRRVHLKRFTTSENYVYKKIIKTEVKNNYIAFSDFVSSKGLARFQQDKKLTELVIVGFEMVGGQPKYISHSKLSKTKANKFKMEQFNKAVKYYWRSGIDILLNRLLVGF